MRIRARRGVCIGVDRHLKAGDPVPGDLDAAQVQFLVSIGAVERVADDPAAELPDVLEDPAPKSAEQDSDDAKKKKK